MTTATGTSRPSLPGVVLGRAAAVLALVSASLHLLLLDASSLGSLAMLGMALTCLPCAWHLWRSPTPGTWGVTAGLDVGMLLVHAQMVGGSAMPGMSHGTSASPLIVLGLAVVATQLLLAAVAGLLLLRNAFAN